MSQESRARGYLIAAFSMLVGCGTEGTKAESSGPSGSGSGADPSTVELGEVEVGSCLGSPYGPPPPSDDTSSDYEANPRLETSVDGSTVTLILRDSTVNCCPSPSATVSASGTTYSVAVVSVSLESACGCECIRDLTVALSSVPEGTWTMGVTLDGEAFGTPAEVTVGAAGG